MSRAAPSPLSGPTAVPPGWRFDLRVALVLAAALLAWDASALDLRLAERFAGADGFAWRESFWVARVLHDGGRWLSAALLAALVIAALRTPRTAAPARGGHSSPSRGERWRALGAVLGCLLLVPALKRLSATSCPWDLALFGGVARHLSHWRWGQADGGPGHCFPSGHAVAAFAFVAQYFLWRRHRPARARAWAAAVSAAGAAFGAGQLARGAHFPSHTLWSAWLCWALCALADAGGVAWERRVSGVAAGIA